MALWDALAPAATVAQLVGTDAAALVSATLQAVRTARRNRGECRALARRVMMVGDLLQLAQQGRSSSEAMRRPEVRRALDGLGGALRRAYELVESCQERGAVYGFVMAGRQAEQFRDVQAEIDAYLLVFPMVSHIDITIRLDRIYNILVPLDSSQQELEVVPMSSPTSHLEPHDRSEGVAFMASHFESNQVVTQTSEVEEHHREGHQESLEELLTRDQRMKWLCWLPQQEAEEHPAYDLLKAAANNFSCENIIGFGAWSTVYKAHIGDGLKVAIKKYPTHVLSVSSQYKSEFGVLKKLEHANIIKLLGHCTGEGEMILVYEYMPNGSLDKIIFDGRGDASLDWLTLFRIIEGIAHGLLYLHTHELCIVHRDLKPSNILLDFDMNSKISDFGIAKMLCPGSSYDTGLSGTYGYMAPEYHRQGILSTKVDVYAYGVILLEAIAGKKSSVPCLQDDEYVNFIEHVWSLWSTGRTFELIDPPLRNNGAQITDISRCIEIALLCVQTDPADRPFMSDVVLMLSNKKTMPFPNRPDVYQSYSPKSEATWSSSDFTWPR
ncbi:unnamed protein product [Urochloa decumbens]|uniref:Protein kinase domain-containing protein n=1 Tax=Urochloa decumbens TaxID=240449 RepID=A0ABC9C1K7_9POAL